MKRDGEASEGRVKRKVNRDDIELSRFLGSCFFRRECIIEALGFLVVEGAALHGELFYGKFANNSKLSRGDQIKARRILCLDVGVDISREGKANANIAFCVIGLFSEERQRKRRISG